MIHDRDLCSRWKTELTDLAHYHLFVCADDDTQGAHNVQRLIDNLEHMQSMVQFLSGAGVGIVGAVMLVRARRLALRRR